MSRENGKRSQHCLNEFGDYICIGDRGGSYYSEQEEGCVKSPKLEMVIEEEWRLKQLLMKYFSRQLEM